MKTRMLLFLLLASLIAGRAQVIDFERLPDGSVPTDGMAISNQFLASFGVTFMFTNGAFPHIAKVGAPITAFWGTNPAHGPDQPRAAQNVGTYFLTDDGVFGAGSPAPPPLVISYARPVATASGTIIDIDYSDAWMVEARNDETQVVATVTLTTNSPNAGDGLATPWSIVRTNADIYSIVITYTGQGNTPGLAFDNFSPALALTPAVLGITRTGQVACVEVAGSFGSAYDVQYTPYLPSTNWQALGRVVLTNAPEQLIFDYGVSNAAGRFYRAIGVQ
jgi:hypothetical protein